MLDRIFDLAKIHDKIISFSPKVKEEYFNYLINEFGVLFTYHSNRIEGTNNTLTLDDTRQIINNTYDTDNVVDSNKKRANYLINSNGEEINFTLPENVFDRMLELKDKYYNKWNTLTVFERSVLLHMAIINIHPFKDGNGRVARLIMNYELIKNNYPPVLINETQKLYYYSVIEEININTDYLNKPFDIGDIKVFSDTIQQLSIVTFKNMQKYYNINF